MTYVHPQPGGVQSVVWTDWCDNLYDLRVEIVIGVICQAFTFMVECQSCVLNVYTSLFFFSAGHHYRVHSRPNKPIKTTRGR